MMRCSKKKNPLTGINRNTQDDTKRDQRGVCYRNAKVHQYVESWKRKSNTTVSTVTAFFNTAPHYLCFPPKSRPATPQRKAQGMSSGEPMCSTCVKYKIIGTKLINTKLALPTMLRKSAASPNLALPRTILKSTWGVNKEEGHLWRYGIYLYPPPWCSSKAAWPLTPVHHVKVR